LVCTYYLPEKYTYTSVDQTFFPEGKEGNSFGMPMLGTISEGNVVTFSHLAGVVCLQIDKMPAESGKVKVTEASNKLCGTFTANLTDTNPEIKTAESSADKSVTFTYSGATADKPGIFYLPVATGDYTLTVVVAGNNKISTTTHSVEMVRERLQQLDITTKYVDATSSLEGKIINGHKFIDLGLPSGLLWAETNIGAVTAYDDGNYYAWGETSPKQIYTDSTYTTLGEWGYSDVYEKFALTYTKYNSTDCKYVLENTDDAAYVNWGTSCRMPTQSEWDELTNAENCTWAWINRTNSDGKTIHCYKVVSNKNNQTIYLPASGYRRGNNLYYYGSYGNYWSRDRSKFNSDPYSLKFNNSGAAYSGLNLESLRYYGFTIRSVAEP
jgi:hypothetical protein